MYKERHKCDVEVCWENNRGMYDVVFDHSEGKTDIKGMSTYTTFALFP